MTISELRAVTQNIEEPPTYRLPRLLSIYLTHLLLPTRVTPNAVTFFQWFLLVAAALFFAATRSWSNVVGAILIFLSYIIDCVDGELARGRGTSSKIGSQLEQMVHWTGGGLLLLGATYATTIPESSSRWIVGFLAIFGDTTFHFMYNQLNMHADPKVNYGKLHLITKLLYRVMPINTNLMIIGGLVNHLFEALLVWAVLSNLSVVIVFGIYYRVEVLSLNSSQTENRISESHSAETTG